MAHKRLLKTAADSARLNRSLLGLSWAFDESRFVAVQRARSEFLASPLA